MKINQTVENLKTLQYPPGKSNFSMQHIPVNISKTYTGGKHVTSAAHRTIQTWDIPLVTVASMETRQAGVRYTGTVSLWTVITFPMETSASYK